MTLKIEQFETNTRLDSETYTFYSLFVDREFSLDPGSNIHLDRVIFIVSGIFDLDPHELLPGDSIEIRHKKLTLRGTGVIYVAQNNTDNLKPLLKITRKGAHKKVSKPWGCEYWINEDIDSISVKKILLNAGYQTSLQYHVHKTETNVIQKGEAELISQAAQDGGLSPRKFTAPQYVHIVPYSIHRIRAITDVELFEVSTPHLDDVIRLEDDTYRPDGKIEAEHE